jgi:hypothetical protein
MISAGPHVCVCVREREKFNEEQDDRHMYSEVLT